MGDTLVIRQGGEKMFETFCIAVMLYYVPLILKRVHFEISRDEHGKVRRTFSYNARAKEKDSNSDE